MIPVGVVAGSVASAAPPSAPFLFGTKILDANSESQSVHDIGWTEPANNGSAITGYNLEYSGDNFTWYFSYSVNSATTATQVGADIGADYYTRVRAVNAIGQGAPSNSYYVSA
jgi:hypothetical protein